MPRTKAKVSPKQGKFQRAKSAISRLFRRGSSVAPGKHEEGAAQSRRSAHLGSDIPMNQIEQAYTPAQTSLKGPFRTSGADRQRDQEFSRGASDGRWNDEDRLTNKSGDPRIGTHGRTYEPGEALAARGRNTENE